MKKDETTMKCKAKDRIRTGAASPEATGMLPPRLIQINVSSGFQPKSETRGTVFGNENFKHEVD